MQALQESMLAHARTLLYKQCMAKAYKLPFLRKEQITHDVWSFFFDRSGVDFDFLPGQYTRMTLPHPAPDDRGTTRHFTIASSPTRKGEIMITTKVIESTFKKSLFDLTPGQEVEIYGPMGKFILDIDDPTPKVFLAGGIGLTPFHSMLKFAAEKQYLAPLYLFVSFSTVSQMVFYNELMEIENKNPNMQVIYTITRSEESPTIWEGETGRISIEMIRKYVPDTTKIMFSFTGPMEFTNSMESMLLNAGVSEEQIKKEIFSGY